MSKDLTRGAQHHYNSSHASRTSASQQINKTYIIDAVEDQVGNRWIKCGTTARFHWFSLEDLQLNEKEVFSALARVGVTCLTSASKQKFKQAIETHEEYRSGLVAAHPGWLGHAFVCGDGSVIQPLGDNKEVIRTFQPNPKFTPKGTLSAWQEDVGCVVADQPLLLFVLCYAFVGPLLRLAPSDVISPQCELVGRRESGKSTVAVMAVSAWAGNPNSDIGGGETWDHTINEIDRIKQEHAGSLLVFDETNLAGSNRKEQQDLIAKSIFKISSTGSKRRFTDVKRAPDVMLALLSTSNEPLDRFLRVAPQVSEAIQSRMVTLRIPDDRPQRALTHIPEGFSTGREAMEYLRAACDRNYGVAGRSFLACLISDVALDESSVRAKIKRYYDGFLDKAANYSDSRNSARVSKLFALTYAAGKLAQAYGVTPKEWGSIGRSVQAIYRDAVGSAEPKALSPYAAVSRYYKENRADLIDADNLRHPISDRAFRKTKGFVRRRDKYTELLIPTEQFQHRFPDYKNIMRALRGEGFAWTEGGEYPKLSIKAPKAICESGRVYCVRLPR